MILDKTIPSFDTFAQMFLVLFYKSPYYGIDDVGYRFVIDIAGLQCFCDVIINPITFASGLPDEIAIAVQVLKE